MFQTNKSKLTSLRAVSTAALPDPSQTTDHTDHRCTDSAACFWHHKTEVLQMLSFKEEAAVSACCLKYDGICDVLYSMETIQADTQSPLKNCTYQSVYTYCVFGSTVLKRTLRFRGMLGSVRSALNTLQKGSPSSRKHQTSLQNTTVI